MLVMQRLHYDDLAGYVRAHGNWKTLTLPAIAPEDARIQLGEHRWHDRKAGELLNARLGTRADLDKRKEMMGSANFSAQYQQNPLPDDGSVIEWGWFRSYTVAPISDFSVGGVTRRGYKTTALVTRCMPELAFRNGGHAY